MEFVELILILFLLYFFTLIMFYSEEEEKENKVKKIIKRIIAIIVIILVLPTSIFLFALPEPLQVDIININKNKGIIKYEKLVTNRLINISDDDFADALYLSIDPFSIISKKYREEKQNSIINKWYKNKTTIYNSYIFSKRYKTYLSDESKDTFYKQINILKVIHNIDVNQTVMPPVIKNSIQFSHGKGFKVYELKDNAKNKYISIIKDTKLNLKEKEEKINNFICDLETKIAKGTYTYDLNFLDYTHKDNECVDIFQIDYGDTIHKPTKATLDNSRFFLIIDMDFNKKNKKESNISKSIIIREPTNSVLHLVIKTKDMD